MHGVGLMVLTDITCWGYSAKMIIGTLVLVMFFKIWLKEKYIPVLLACLVLMVFFQVFTDGFLLYTRTMRLTNPEIYHYIVNSLWWTFRLIPEGIVLIVVLVRITAIAYCPERYNKGD